LHNIFILHYMLNIKTIISCTKKDSYIKKCKKFAQENKLSVMSKTKKNDGFCHQRIRSL